MTSPFFREQTREDEPKTSHSKGKRMQKSETIAPLTSKGGRSPFFLFPYKPSDTHLSIVFGIVVDFWAKEAPKSQPIFVGDWFLGWALCVCVCVFIVVFGLFWSPIHWPLFPILFVDRLINKIQLNQFTLFVCIIIEKLVQLFGQVQLAYKTK